MPEEASTESEKDVNLLSKPGLAGEASRNAAEADERNPVEAAENMSPSRSNQNAVEIAATPVSSPVQLLGSLSPEKSPAKSWQHQTQQDRTQLINPERAPPDSPPEADPSEADPVDADPADVTRSPSEGSSPIRPMVRKSSLNFASLPAREPLTSKKSLGARMSRTSHVDQSRTSYFPRHTGGGKSLGVRQDALEDEEDVMDIDEENDIATSAEDRTQDVFASHNRTYTQRLQDQISMLGKSQGIGAKPTKSVPNLAGAQPAPTTSHAQTSAQSQSFPADPLPSPSRHQQLAKTPGAFPEDEEDDWIAPPTTKSKAFQSPRPVIGKSHSTDAIEGLRGKNTTGSVEVEPTHHQSQEPLLKALPYSPKKRPPLTHQNSSNWGHGKSTSVPDLTEKDIFGDAPDSSVRVIKKAVSVSNPVTKDSQDVEMSDPLRSPSRTSRESPVKQNALKQVKNKFSMILKGSKGLLASSAALSAEGKASLVNSPSITKLREPEMQSVEPAVLQKDDESLYPDLSKHLPSESRPAPSRSSPSATNQRKTRASAERDRRDQRQKEKEEREAQHLAEQMEKLEKAREKEREKARVFSIEKDERMATERQLSLQKEREAATRTPAPKDPMPPIRTSPRKAQAQVETEKRSAEVAAEMEDQDQDAEMADAPPSKPAPPSIPRPTPGQSLKAREIKRPLKPSRETATKPKQAPTLIRVNTSSQHSGFHPSNSVLAATLQETLGSSSQQAKTKAGQPSIQAKSSSQSLKSSVSSTTGRPKALELAERRRQEEEKKAQRKRDLKAEMERKREEERRQEEERRERERARAAAEEEAKKAAARQAAIEKAKQTRAPPPALRSQPHGPPTSVSRPPSRLGQSSTQRALDDTSRPVKAALASSTAKMPLKRPLQQENSEDGAQRPAGAWNGPSQPKEMKRARLSDEFNPEEEAEIQSYGSSIKGPPVRPSTGFKKVSRLS